MKSAIQGDLESDAIPVRVTLNILPGVENSPVYTSYDIKRYNVCLGEYEKNESRSETVEMPLLKPIGVEMKGAYTRGDNGRDTIEAEVKTTTTMPHDLYKDICPEKTLTVNGSIRLERCKQ